jgi:Leucine-rich repeat (LRR) protein
VLNLEEKELDDIGEQLSTFEHLRDLNLSKNKLVSIERLRTLQYLQVLMAQENQLQNIDFLCENPQQLRFLTKADFSSNKLQKLPKILCSALKNLNLDNNEIGSCSLSNHQAIEVLSLNKNKLKSLEGLSDLYSLKSLSVNENEEFSSLKGLSNCPKLTRLSLAANPKLESIDVVPDLPALQELILTGSPISKLADLEKLKTLRNLKSLNVAETPIAEEKGDDLKKEILILLDTLNLKTINGDPITKEEVEEARNEKMERIKAAEEERKQKELEAAKGADDEDAE